ncbi:MAG: NAD-binding protein [bacterium]|nr:NAD-binding protein [bacterium]
MVSFITRYWKPLLVLIVFFSAWISFLHTDMVIDSYPEKYFQAFYFSIELFLVGGLDTGFPHGGSQFFMITLWVCYFLAPLVTVSFVYQVVQEKIFSHLVPSLKGHTIICGLGRNGKLIYELVKSYSPKRHRIVIIEKDANNSYRELLSKDRTTWWLKSDFTKLPVLMKAKIQTASRIFLTTNLDLANLNALVEILDIEKKSEAFKIFCHLGDLNLHANFEATIFREKKFADVILFNGYQCVTRRLYNNWIKEKELLSPGGNIFIILGFGRFGQMLYSHLVLDEERNIKDEIFITTLKAKSTFDLEKLQYNWTSEKIEELCKVHKPEFLDMNSPVLWHKLAKLDRSSKKQMFIFACSDNDIANLNLAISMKLNGPPRLKQTTIFCRMYSHTAADINEILERRITKSQSRDIVLFPLQEELKEAFRRELFQ